MKPRGLRGPDAYLKDENGNPIPETIRRYDMKALKWLLQKYRPEEYGNHRKNDDPPQEGGVLVVRSPLEILNEQESSDASPSEDVEIDAENDSKGE